MSLVQKAHASDMQQLKTSQNMEMTKLKEELDELRSFNEKGEAKIQRVQMDNELLRNTVEECQNQTTTLEIMKTKSLEKNEELQSTQKRLFDTLDKILVIRHEQTKFNSQVKATHEKYQKALEACNKITEWKDSLQTVPSPETLPTYSDERRI
jgi:argininosuccinate lyase